jgi:sugar lactone lactonase YvrE
MSTLPLEPVVEGLDFPECPRWHDGALWWSDMQRRRVSRWDPRRPSDEPVVVAELDDAPGGLGWDADGTLLAVTMMSKRLLAISADGTVTERAALGSAVPEASIANDMVVGPGGHAYVGLLDALLPTPEPRPLLAVAPDGTVRVAADDLHRPNGAVITPDGERLVVAESTGARLTAFRLDADGGLHDRHVWADLPGWRPDGIAIDASGAIWVADLTTHAVVRVVEGGAVTDTRPTGERWAVAPVLGGPDGHTLYVCTSGHLAPFADGPPGTGRIEAVTVAVGAVGVGA